MQRILSSQFPDDHSVYHHEDGEGTHIDADATSIHKTETERRDANSSSSDDDSTDDVDEKDEAEGEAAHGYEVVLEEIRGGVPYEHDVEAAPPLKREKSSRSVKDPNLVSRSAVPPRHSLTATR